MSTKSRDALVDFLAAAFVGFCVDRRWFGAAAFLVTFIFLRIWEQLYRSSKGE